MKLHYTDRHRLPGNIEKELGLTYLANVESLVPICDIISLSCPYEYITVDKGKLAGTGIHSYSAGDATGGSEEAVKFKESR